MLRVLHILGSADRGGTEIMTTRLVGKLPSSVRSTLCFLTRGGPIADELARKGYEVHCIPVVRTWEAMSGIWRLFRLIRMGCFDVLHLYGLRANLLGRVLGRMAGQRVIVGGLRSMSPHSSNARWAFWLDRATFKLSTGYISNSRAAAELLAARGYNPAKLWVVHNGVDVNVFRPRRGNEADTVKRELGVSARLPVVTCVANLRSPKRHCDLLEALAMVRRSGFRFEAILVGDGPLRASLEKMASDIGLGRGIRFLGKLKNDKIADILGITDIFVLASEREGLPASLLEAMASGCPVVATAVGGIPEVILDGLTGFLVPRRNPRALADKLAQLLSDADLCASMSAQSRKHVAARFTVERMAEGYEDLYRWLTGD